MSRLAVESALNQLRAKVLERTQALGAVGLVEQLISYNWQDELGDYLDNPDARDGHILVMMLGLEMIFAPDNYKDSLIQIEKGLKETEEE